LEEIMFCIDYNNKIHIHFIGIGGVSMSGLATILAGRGFTVTGSDGKPGPATDRLKELGIKIYEGNLASNLDIRPDVVVYTAAIHPDNPEYARAVELNIPLLTRGELLGQIMKNYRTSIGVSGTHGKTTTTSFLSHILLDAKLSPTISVGGNLPVIGGNIHIEDGDTFLTEACEYTNSFLSFFPTMELILNVEADHLDFFRDIDDIRHSFRKYAELLPDDGQLIINSSIRDFEYFTQGLNCDVITFGPKGCTSDYTYADEKIESLGCYSFTIVAGGKASDGERVTLKVPGTHNILNALAAIAAADRLGIDPSITLRAIEEFTGTDRRFQKKGEIGGVTIIDDYAHHPQEITATLEAAKNYPHNRLHVIFQPHTYTRTKLLFDDFARALQAADEVVVAKIYPARETDSLGMSAALLSEAVSRLGTPSVAFEDFEDIEDYILTHCEKGDVVITMGAGDVYKIGESLLGNR